MNLNTIQNTIEKAWLIKEQINPYSSEDIIKAVEFSLQLLETGKCRVAEKKDGVWKVNTWLKKAVLLSFRISDMRLIPGGPDNSFWWDKVSSKFHNWSSNNFYESKFRAVPGAIARKGCFIDEEVVLMPSFINLGAYIGKGTMIDTWSTIGSCAQIGSNCHISGGVGIGGVLEPLQANPVIIEDNCFIGARSEVAEGVVVKEGSVLSMGVFLGASTKIINRSSGDILYGTVPPYSVVVPGTLPVKSEDFIQPSLACAVIVKTVDEKTRSKTSVNDLLRN